jgi:hypothetical protein
MRAIARIWGLAWLALAFVGIAVLPTSAQAKVIGIVFDDSGSMDGQLNLPTFGAELLISSLDGSRDRVLTLRMSQLISAMSINGTSLPPNGGIDANTVAAWLATARGPVVIDENIRTRQAQQATIDAIARTWPEARLGTPYEVIEVMLDRLSREAKPEEEAHLLVLTDGGFNLAPDLGAIERSYRTYRERLTAKRATLSVDFIAIGLKDRNVFAAIDRQGVRSTLLRMFNGDPRRGAHDVSTAAELFEATKDIIARVAATDRRGAAARIREDGDALVIDSLLSLTQIIAVSTAVLPTKAARLIRPPAPPQDRIELQSRTTKQDRTREDLVGETVQLRYQPGLDAGSLRVEFDRRPAGQTFLLFETGARAEIEIKSVDGRTIAPSADGGYDLPTGVDYRIETRLLDSKGGKVGPVRLADLVGSAHFDLVVEEAAGRRILPAKPDTAIDRAVAELSGATPGSMTVRAQVRFDGFITPPSRPVPVRLIDVAVGFTSEVTGRETCTECANGEVGTLFDGTPGDRPIADVTIASKAAMNGSMRLDTRSLPAWAHLTEADGRRIADGETLRLDPSRPLKLQVWRHGSAADFGRDPTRLAFAIEAEAPLKGRHDVAFAVRPRFPDARLTHTGSNMGSPEIVPSVGMDALRNGDLKVDLLLTNTVAAPTERDFRVTVGDDWARSLIGSTLSVDAATGAVHWSPRVAWYCECLMAFASGHRRVTVAYAPSSGQQSAEASFDVDIAPSVWDIFVVGCGKFLLGLLAAAWLLAGLVNWRRACRFPRGSVLEVAIGRELPRHLDLRHLNWTLPRAIAFPFVVPHETRRLEGLTLRASPNGALLMLQKSSGDVVVVSQGETIARLIEDHPQMRTVKIVWSEELERPGRPKTVMRLTRSLGEKAFDGGR